MAFGGRIGPDLSTKLPQRAPETAGLRITIFSQKLNKYAFMRCFALDS